MKGWRGERGVETAPHSRDTVLQCAATLPEVTHGIGEEPSGFHSSWHWQCLGLYIGGAVTGLAPHTSQKLYFILLWFRILQLLQYCITVRTATGSSLSIVISLNSCIKNLVSVTRRRPRLVPTRHGPLVRIYDY